MLVVGESVDFITAVCDKQFSAGGSHVTAAMLLEHSKLLRMFAEPHQIAVGFREQALELRVVREFFDDNWLAHSRIIIGLMNRVKQFREYKERLADSFD